MNLELEQRHKDLQARSRQLEDQKRSDCKASWPWPLVCLLSSYMFVCREIAELKELLESQTEVNASLQRRLQDKQESEQSVQQVCCNTVAEAWLHS